MAQETRTKSLAPRSESTYQSYIDAYSHIMATEFAIDAFPLTDEKITGFWRTCRRCGLTGRQGVIIPRQNIKSLVLPREVESALEEGSFHIWAVSDIEEGMEIMTGLPSGKRNARGIFPPGTFNRKIEDRLRKLYESGKSN